MRKLGTTLAATAAAAAVAAAITIPATAQNGGKDGGKDGADQSVATFATCLRAHGADAPAGTDGFALKTWIGAHEAQPDVRSALDACGSGGMGAPDNAKAESLRACLRGQGLTVPDAIDQLKPYIVTLSGTPEGTAKLRACKIEVGSDDDAANLVKKPGDAGCGQAVAPAQAASKKAKAAPKS
jgi:hypothetical protein